MVREGLSCSFRDMVAQEKAPMTPKMVTTILMAARAAGPISRVVLAKRTAVPLTVAMPSLRRNQAARKRSMSRRWRARRAVLPREDQA